YTILIVVTALTVPSYLAAFWAPLGRGVLEIAVAFAVIVFVLIDNVMGVSARRLRRRVLITAGDLVLQAIVIVLGVALVFHPHRLTESIHLGTAPTAANLAFALPIAVIAFTGLEAAASLIGEVTGSNRSLKHLILPGSAIIVVIYVGIALVGVAALRPKWIADVLKYAVAIGGALGLAAASGSAMLGVSRVGSSLATNRQIPSAVG